MIYCRQKVRNVGIWKKNNENKKEILIIHDYETCEIISYDIANGNEKFLKWIEEETK